MLLVAALPLFRENARRIALILDEDKDRSAAIQVLAQCHHITELSLQVEPEDYPSSSRFNLSSVERAFPFLETLTLTGLCKYEGSLNYANLKCLVISMQEDCLFKSSLIPFQSARTLVTLILVETWYFDFRGNNPFDSLPNLTHLELVPFEETLQKHLITTKIKLLQFTTTIWLDDPSTENLTATFSSPCFQRLQSLTLNNENLLSHAAEYWKHSEEILTIITRHLRSLQTLEIYMALDMSWFSSLVHLTYLKTLRWGIAYKSELLLSPVKSSAKAVEEFQKIFADFKQMPRFIIVFDHHFNSNYYYSELNRLRSTKNLSS
jgi:hypothetical protein